MTRYITPTLVLAVRLLGKRLEFKPCIRNILRRLFGSWISLRRYTHIAHQNTRHHDMQPEGGCLPGSWVQGTDKKGLFNVFRYQTRLYADASVRVCIGCSVVWLICITVGWVAMFCIDRHFILSVLMHSKVILHEILHCKFYLYLHCCHRIFTFCLTSLSLLLYQNLFYLFHHQQLLNIFFSSYPPPPPSFSSSFFSSCSSFSSANIWDKSVPINSLDCFTFEDGTHRLSRNVGN